MSVSNTRVVVHGLPLRHLHSQIRYRAITQLGSLSPYNFAEFGSACVVRSSTLTGSPLLVASGLQVCGDLSVRLETALGSTLSAIGSTELLGVQSVRIASAFASVSLLSSVCSWCSKNGEGRMSVFLWNLTQHLVTHCQFKALEMVKGNCSMDKLLVSE